MFKRSHPWRNVNPWRTRSQQFTQYLQSLPTEERKKIEAEEQRFLAKREMPYSHHVRVAKDFGACLLGVREEA